MYPQANLDSYQRQASDVVAKIGQLQQLQNPLSLQPAPPMAIPPHIDYVQGLDGAKEYLKNMPANGNTILMDRDEAKFYVVSKDANGNPAPIAFAHFTLETEKPPEKPDYITRQDFEKFKAELKNMLKGEEQ